MIAVVLAYKLTELLFNSPLLRKNGKGRKGGQKMRTKD